MTDNTITPSDARKYIFDNMTTRQHLGMRAQSTRACFWYAYQPRATTSSTAMFQSDSCMQLISLVQCNVDRTKAHLQHGPKSVALDGAEQHALEGLYLALLELTEVWMLLQLEPRLYWRNLALQLESIAHVEQSLNVCARNLPGRGTAQVLGRIGEQRMRRHMTVRAELVTRHVRMRHAWMLESEHKVDADNLVQRTQ